MRKMGVCFTLILVLVLGVTMTVKVSAAGKEQSRSKNRQAVEEEYLEEVKLILLEKGCKNSGVMLNYVTDAEGNLEYTLTLHHARLEKMEKDEWLLMTARIQEKAQLFFDSEVHLKQI